MSKISRRDWIKLVGASGTIGAVPSTLWAEEKREKAPVESGELLIDQSSILKYIRRHDPIWEVAAKTWNQGLLLGNGDLGVNVWGDGAPLVFSLDKSDVWETRHWSPPKTFTWENFRHLLETGVVTGKDRSWEEEWGRPKVHGQDIGPYPTRVPIGRLELLAVGHPRGAAMHLDLATATARGELRTGAGNASWQCFVAATEPLIVLELTTEGKEADLRLGMRTYTGEDPISASVYQMLRDKFGYPPPRFGRRQDVSCWSQSMLGSGEYAVAWREFRLGSNRRAVYITIAFTREKTGAAEEAIQRISGLSEDDAERLKSAHDSWWASYYHASFLSIPDTRLEGLYWNEIYKLASATRPGKKPITLVGVWAPDGEMPAWQGDYHWDINVQMTYWPIYASNRLEFAMPLYDMLDGCRPQMQRYAKDIFGVKGESLLSSTDFECNPTYGWPEGQLAFSSLPWAVHHYWLHWKYSQDKDFLRARAVPIMKAAIQPLLHQLQKGPDGKLHIPLGLSPEYQGNTGTFWGPDPTMDLAVLRFLLQSLIEADAMLNARDPERPTWEQVLAQLTEFAIDPVQGLKVRADLPYESSHRHHSHLSPIYPFHEVTLEKDRDLIDRSIHTWILRGHGEWVGFSWTWAASIAAHVGRSTLARTLLLDYTDRFITENTLMFQGALQACDMTVWESGNSSTLEAGFGFLDAVQNMLIQSHNGVIRVFPAAPPAWASASFWRLRAEGAFLVSAQQSDGKAEFVELISEKGGTARVRSTFGSYDMHVEDMKGPREFRLDHKDVVLETAPGDRLWIWAGPKPNLQIRPIAGSPDEYHFFGVKKRSRW